MNEIDWLKSEYSNTVSQISSLIFHFKWAINIFELNLFIVNVLGALKILYRYRASLHCEKKNQMSDHSARKPISRTPIVNIVYLYVWGTVISTEACRGCRTLQAKWLRSQKHHLFAIQHSKVISCLHLRFCSLCFQCNEIWNDKKKYMHTTDGKIDELLQSNNLSNWLTCSN